MAIEEIEHAHVVLRSLKYFVKSLPSESWENVAIFKIAADSYFSPVVQGEGGILAGATFSQKNACRILKLQGAPAGRGSQ